MYRVIAEVKDGLALKNKSKRDDGTLKILFFCVSLCLYICQSLAPYRQKISYTGCLGLVHWDYPEGWYGEGGERRVQDGEHMYYLWRIHFDIWQNQYNIVKFKNKIKLKKNNLEGCLVQGFLASLNTL